jgi:hypothetical protein
MFKTDFPSRNQGIGYLYIPSNKYAATVRPRELSGRGNLILAQSIRLHLYRHHRAQAGGGGIAKERGMKPISSSDGHGWLLGGGQARLFIGSQ